VRAAVLGGSSVGPATLVRFYALHCFVLPLVGGLLMALHFWRVRKDGITTPL
jgi:quinol-cytochrome oxidoreductase complex cytochrome b subunit